MKCPKCGYVSFDHNQACPKCKKDISAERNKLNLPDFEPSVPFLLGALTGEAEEAGMDIDLSGPEAPVLSPPDEELAAEPLSNAGSEESLEEEAIEFGESDQDLSLDLEDIEGPSEEEGDIDLSGGEEDSMPMDLEMFSSDESPTEEPPAEEESVVADDDMSLDLEELGLDDDELTGAVTEDASSVQGEEPEMELESIPLDDADLLTEEPAPDEEEEQEIVLNLDELKVNETGELEIGSPEIEPPLEADDALGAKETIDLDGIGLEETTDEEKPADTEATTSEALDDFTMDLDELSLEDETGQTPENDEEDFSLDLDDLELELDLEEEEPKESS